MERRRTFDENPARYDRYRPEYPDELYREMFRYAGLKSGMKALEIGVGTGLATRPILETGCQVVAVEVGPNLAEYVRRKFSGAENFRAVCADFEKFEPDERFDLIYSATAFHWIPEETGYPKVLRLLKPGGAAALFWNRPRPGEPLRAEIQKIYRKHRPGEAAPEAFSERDCRKVADALGRYGFEEVAYRLFHRTRTLSAAGYAGLLETYSDHQAMAEGARCGLISEVEAAIAAHGGEITIHDTMDLYLARRGD